MGYASWRDANQFRMDARRRRKDRAKELHAKGYTAKQIAQVLSISTSSVWRYIRER